jgi:hypothetical protein
MLGIGFIVLLLVLSIPAFIFSILSWRLRTDAMFLLGAIFTGILFLFYLLSYELFIFLLMDINSLLIGLFLLVMLAIPVYFLIASKMAKPVNPDSDVTDDYLTKIIESDDEDIDYEH